MEIEIEKIANKGVGIGYNEINKVVFVPYTAIGEIVEIEVVKSSKNYDIAKKINIIKPSKDRIDPICNNFEICGGCDFMHIDYDVELQYKKDVLSNIFKEEIKINSSNDSLYYRNKVVFHADYRSGKLKLGFMMNSTNRVVAVDNCFMVDRDVIKLKKELESLNILLLEDVVFRVDDKTILINFLGNKKYFDKYKKKILKLNSKKKLIIYYNSKLISKSNKYLEYMVNGIKYFVGSSDFFQINRSVAEDMFGKVRDFLTKINDIDLVVDGFCGSMTIGIQVKDYSKKIVGIEINNANVELAKKNILQNSANNCEIVEGDFFKEIKKINLVNSNKSVLIVDPPREGIGKKVMEFINNLAFDYIIYISCDAMTFKRDVDVIKDSYKNELLEAYDMFPRTHHLEVLSIYKRIN